MPKNELLKRIDESQQSALMIDRDTVDPTETSTPSVPSGITVQSVQDGVLVEVDFVVDTAHLHPRFQSFIVYAKPVGSEVADGSGMEVGRFSDSDWTWQPNRGGYTGWLLALSAISNTGYESDKSDWYYCVLSTFYDDFSDYGGDEITDLESLWWLAIADFDTDETWDVRYGTLSSETVFLIEGDRAVKVEMESSIYWRAEFYKTVALDLSNDGRFGDDDYVVIPIYVSNEDAYTELHIYFVSSSSNWYRVIFTAADRIVRDIIARAITFDAETAVVSIAVARDIARHEMTDALTALRAKVWDA